MLPPFTAGTDPNNLIPSVLMGGRSAGDKYIVAGWSSADPKVIEPRGKQDIRHPEERRRYRPGIPYFPHDTRASEAGSIWAPGHGIDSDETRPTLFRDTDVITKRNVNPISYGESSPTDGIRLPSMSCYTLWRQPRRLRSCGGRRG